MSLTGKFSCLVDAFVYVLMMLPRRLLDTTPVIALLGTLVPLGLLADGNEILAIRAAGVSLRRLIGMVLMPGLVLLVLMLLAQFVSLAVRLWVGGGFPAWTYVLSSVFGALAWPLVNWVLLAPQRRPLERDETRPL